MKTRIEAHRGLHAEARENTVEAFAAAVAAGVDGVELDVRWSGDRHLVIHHDAEVEGAIVAATAAADLPGYVPTLAQALDALTGVCVNIEIKNIRDASEPTYDESGQLARDVIDLLAARGWRDDCVISSFDLATCEQVHALAPELEVGWLIWSQSFDEALEGATRAGLAAVNVNFRHLPDGGIAEAHSRGLKVNVWTVNDPATMTRLFEAGVDTVITDDPVAALALRG